MAWCRRTQMTTKTHTGLRKSREEEMWLAVGGKGKKLELKRLGHNQTWRVSPVMGLISLTSSVRFTACIPRFVFSHVPFCLVRRCVPTAVTTVLIL